MTSSPQEHKVIAISSGTIVRTILFILLFVSLYYLRDIVLSILTAIVIASAVEPAARWFEKRKVPRALGVIIVYLLAFLIIALSFYLFVPAFLDNLAYIIAHLPEYAQALEVWSLPGAFGEFSGAITVENIVNQIVGSLGIVAGGVFGVASNIFGGVLSFLIIVVLSFYLAVQRDGISHFLRIVTPLKYESYVIDLWTRSQRKIGRWLQGQLILSVIVGIFVYLGLMILGVKNAFVLALLAAMFELIPLFGPILAAVPAIAVALIDGGISLGVMVLLLYVIIQQFENHLLHPLVVKKVVGVPALVVIIALLIGGTFAGFLGIILAVPIAAALMEYASDVERRKRHTKEMQNGQVSN